MKSTPLFKLISDAVVNGELPEDFSLPKLSDDNCVIAFADGAMDGIGIYHMQAKELSESELSLIAGAIQAVNMRDFGKADELFLKLSETVNALYAIDAIQNYIVENKDALKASNLSEYAIALVRLSSNRECVKYGLSVLELFDLDRNEPIKNDIRTIGLSDEFTLFSLYVMHHWKDGNDEIFRLAKKVHGWGRIHAIELLEPETEEIRRWLLTDAVHNNISPSYSALTCWRKSDAEQVLKSHPTYEEFAGIRDLLDGLFNEGPVTGISALENEEEIVQTFLDEVQTMQLELKDYELMHTILAYCKKTDAEKCSIALSCRKFLTSYRCWCLVKDAVIEGKNIDMAVDIGFPCKPYIIDLMKSSFEEHYPLCRHLAHDAESRKILLDLYREKLPLETMKTLPGTTLGLGKEYWRQSALEFLLQELRQYPFEGQEFVETALQSEPVRTRNGALYVLEFWVATKGKPLSEILPGFYDLLTRLRALEPTEHNKDRMDKLLSGATVFDEVGEIKKKVEFTRNTLNILADAISDIGSWQWWEIGDDMVQMEFCDVQLYDDSKAEKEAHSSTIAVRFYGNTFAVFLDNIEDEEWPYKLYNDNIAPFPLETYELDFDNVKFAKEVMKEYKHRHPMRPRFDESLFSSTKHLMAGKCDGVGFVVGGDEIKVVTHNKKFTEENIEAANKRWWRYWEDYWRKGKKEGYEKDWACEVSIPVDLDNPIGNYHDEE